MVMPTPGGTGREIIWKCESCGYEKIVRPGLISSILSPRRKKCPKCGGTMRISGFLVH